MEEKLIEAGRSRPLIYDLGRPEYKNIRLREKYWDEIAAIVGEPTQRCRQRWKSLRERARKEFTTYAASGSGSGEPASWPHDNSLLFLRVKFGVTKTISNFTEELENSAQDDMCDPGTQSSDGELATILAPATPRQSASSLSFPSSSTTPSPTPRRRRKVDDGRNEILSGAVQSFNNLLGDIRSKVVAQKATSPMMLFFENLNKRIENKYTDSQELELQQAFLEVFIKKTREFNENK